MLGFRLRRLLLALCSGRRDKAAIPSVSLFGDAWFWPASSAPSAVRSCTWSDTRFEDQTNRRATRELLASSERIRYAR
ncbi:hypothetical protein EVAR_64029_1 [Eumeta japonica]|uniref:Uncharacterized protein n=1 Tax=Eumeta variegata TaxID=151549 RepID=A0A4C1Z778_EUMVA|nr:hypothetical protein EVAR_64029_1 [Eumeta japonica]